MGQHIRIVGLAEIQRFPVPESGLHRQLPASMSSIQIRILDFGRRDLVFFKFLVEGAARDPKTLRGLLDTSMLLIEHSLDVLLFELNERQIGIEKGGA